MGNISELTRDALMFTGLTASTFGTLTIAADKLGWFPTIPYLKLLFWGSLIATLTFASFAIAAAMIFIISIFKRKP
jgi:hypothetical protein